MPTGLFLIAAEGEGSREIDVECGLSADERRVESGECIGENLGGVGIAEAGECVAAPASEVHGVECDVGSVVGRIAGKEFGGSVEGVQAGGVVAVGGEGFSVCGCQPRSQDAWYGCFGAASGALE